MDPYQYSPPPYPPPRPPGRLGPLLVSLLIGLALGAIAFRYVLNKGTPAVESRPVAPATLAADEQSTISLFKRISPSVVYITTLTQRMNMWTRNVTEIPQGTGSG